MSDNAGEGRRYFISGGGAGDRANMNCSDMSERLGEGHDVPTLSSIDSGQTILGVCGGGGG
jgi:hypothetical protein